MTITPVSPRVNRVALKFGYMEIPNVPKALALARKNADSERTPPCAYAHARAREKSLKNFRLVPLRRRYAQRCRALAVIMPIHADLGAGLVGAA